MTNDEIVNLVYDYLEKYNGFPSGKVLTLVSRNHNITGLEIAEALLSKMSVARPGEVIGVTGAVISEPLPPIVAATIGVKALIWNENGFAHTGMGSFYVVRYESGFWKLEKHAGSSQTNSAHPDEHAAMAFAQADYEEHIRSALVYP